MSKNYIITIGREYGSGGFEIGKKLSEKLGIKFYDKNLIDEVAKKSGIHPDVISKADEKPSNPLLNPFFNPVYENGTLNDRIFWAQSDIIREIASKESCVIIGRCADYILNDHENVLRIFIQAPFNNRVLRVKEKYLIDVPDEAKREVKKTDKQRRSYYEFYTDNKWGGRKGQDLIINSSVLGIDGTVDFIKALVERKFDL